jgi:hypothetical protein
MPFDRGFIIWGVGGSARLTQKILPGASRRRGDFLSGTLHGLDGRKGINLPRQRVLVAYRLGLNRLNLKLKKNQNQPCRTNAKAKLRL